MSKLYIADKTTLDKVLDKVDMILGNIMTINDDEALKTKVAANYFNTKRNGKVFGVFFNDFSISNSPTGTRKYDAVGMIARPSTDSDAERNDFDSYAIFNGLTVNGYVGTDGEFVVTYFEGEDGFDKYSKDTYILFGTSYVNIEINAYGETISVSDTKRDGYFPMGGAVRLDKTIRPFIPIAKYLASDGADGSPASVSGKIPYYNNASESWNITKFHSKGNQYCSTTIQDRFMIETLFEVVFATRNSQSVMSGCTSYYTDAVIEKAETNTKRAIISKANASNFVVGSTICVGDWGSNTSHDVNASYYYNLANRVKILSKEEVTIDGTTYVALNLDCEPITTTLTSRVGTAPWYTGACDNVLGTCGSPNSNTDGKNPYIFFGVELANGQYEVIGNALYKQANNGTSMIGHLNVCYDSVNLSTSVDGNYVQADFDMPGGANAWKYVSELGFDKNNPCVRGATKLDAGSSTGYCDGNYMNNSDGTYEVLVGGHLHCGSYAGLWCRDLGNAVSGAGWCFSARLSATGRSGVIAAA